MSSESEVEQLRTEVEDLRSEVVELREVVEEVESGSQGSAAVKGRFDSRDGSVLTALDGREGEEFHVRALMAFYRDNTDIRRKETLKRRVKDLAKSDVFESVGGNRHRFVGSRGGDSNEW